jgi:hypothetical protein
MASKKKTAKKKAAKKTGKTTKKVGRKKAAKKGGRKKSPAAVGGPRKCSLCGVRGHNRRGHDAFVGREL